MSLRKNAFSLLEITVVLTVIGLLLASALLGKKMVKGADLRALMRQYERYSASIHSFYDKYDAYPGDFRSAYEYWPDDCETEAFCNGDGDQRIEAYKESHLVWYHLAQSGFIGGNYTGAGDGDDNTQTKSVNVPKGSYYPVQLSVVFYEGTEFQVDRHYMIMGAAKSEDIGYAPAFAPDPAYVVDQKIDDGNPGLGKVFGRNGYADDDYDNSNCLIDTDGEHVSNTASDIEDAIYNSDLDSLECFLALRI